MKIYEYTTIGVEAYRYWASISLEDRRLRRLDALELKS